MKFSDFYTAIRCAPSVSQKTRPKLQDVGQCWTWQSPASHPMPQGNNWSQSWVVGRPHHVSYGRPSQAILVTDWPCCLKL